MEKPVFKGFTDEGFRFLREMKRLQDDLDFNGARAFYARDKNVYERAVKAPLGALMEILAARLQASGVPLKGDRKTALFRINRDVRFSRDKSPYKTHAGAVLTPTGSRKEQGVLYVHIDPSGCLMAAGFHMPEPSQLAKLRRHIAEKPEAFRAMTAKLAEYGIALGDSEGSLKRLPRGFEDVTDPDIAAAVKLKGYITMAPLDDRDVMEPELLDKLEVYAKQVLPLLEFGWEALRREE